ncbi:hybrid sensor histidine kinase/response regulator [Altererythrobacter lutimaris]|uniref:histidine kinase n=1 Tax=Altererythrobacter lutimaris TaxID=2743979 RepID=A0A850H9B5_9SPHN|nr:response regulator [Altererythrobacter lutimaris]NVE94090.1 response regulator [Altererythrobacter lutimaris]
MIAGLGLAFILSLGALWTVSENIVLLLSFGAGLVILSLVAFALERMRNIPALDVEASADWSVTLAAMELPGIAIAITDRANRLVCANTAYVEAFGAALAPTGLSQGREASEALMRLAREARRDGKAEADQLQLDSGTAQSSGEQVWNVVSERVGQAEEYLLWRLKPVVTALAAELIQYDVAGPFGAMLSRAGIEAAVTSPDGLVRNVSAGFAERAAGDANATLAGQDFVSFLRSDDRDRIFFAREGQSGTPQTLIHVPLETPAGENSTSPDQGQSLMLLVDTGVGIGGSWDGGSQAGVAQLEALLSQLPLGLAMTDRDGRFLFGNTAFLRSIDRENRGMPPFPTDIVVREDKAALSDAVRRHGRGPATSGNMAVRLASRPDEPVSLGLAGVRGLGEAAVLLILADSSEETQLKRQVAQATKMQAVGQLAGGVAHDFNNVLTAIIGTCDLMLLRHTPGDSDYDDIQQVKNNSNRAAALTRQLLAFSRQQTLRPEIIQLPDVVSEVGPLIKRLIGEKIAYDVKHDRDLGAVRADPQQLEQVIMNLAVNARDAIQSRGNGEGRIALSTHRVRAGEVEQMGSEILPTADYTMLVVEDDGGGIPPQALSKLFEPFFTTKEQGKGTGLGLSTVYGIVKQSGGFIFVTNTEDDAGRVKGARFTLYFPVNKGERPAAKEPVRKEKTREWSGGGKILLVEDEDMVRAVAERALARSGYTVTACADGELGLAEIQKGGAFDLIVSDVVMPGMDGPAMARAIREIQPDIPVLFMSGYAEEQLRKDIDIPNMHFMPKPFSVQQIGDKVAEVMRESAALE